MDLFWWFALPVAAGTFYGCYFWNQRHAQPDWLRLIIAFATPASPATRCSFAPKSPLYKHPHSLFLYGDVWRWQMLTSAKQQRAHARGREMAQAS